MSPNLRNTFKSENWTCEEDGDLGLWDKNLFDYEAVYDVNFSLNKAERLVYHQTALTHAMLFEVYALGVRVHATVANPDTDLQPIAGPDALHVQYQLGGENYRPPDELPPT